ncbi:MAG: hypothetical protein ACREVE_05805 [Gammaproteobacteria bacterium]
MKKQGTGWVKDRRADLKHYRDYARLLNVWTSRPEKKYVIVTQSRSGTGLLATLMGQHPDILADGEVFNKFLHRQVRWPGLYLKARSKRAIALDRRVYGFKLKYHHLVSHQEMSDQAAQHFILDLYDQGWKFIYLRRNNVLRRALSGIIARKRQLLHVRDRQALPKVHLDRQELMQEIELSERLLAIDENNMARVDHLLVEYENDLLDAASHAGLCTRIFKFLDVPQVAIKPSYLEKTSADDLSLTIENYADVEAWLRDSPHVPSLQSHRHYPPAAVISSRVTLHGLQHDTPRGVASA